MTRSRKHFEDMAPDYDRWKRKARYYHAAVKAAIGEIVPPRSRVAEVGCGTGEVLASLRPSDGLGIDVSARMVEMAAAKYPSLRFKVHDLTSEPLGEHFPYVIAVDVAEHVEDLAAFMDALAGVTTTEGRVVVVTANPLWAPVLHAAERLRLKMPEGPHEWRSRADLLGAAGAAGLVERSFDRFMLIPKEIPGLKALNTARWISRLRQHRGLIQRAVYAGG